MYFLEKLCRICVRTEGPLVDINTVDFDLVKLSEKLEICTSLAISNDPISSEICEKCANKLRVSYHFLDMCKNSTNIIQGYFAKLTQKNEETAVNSESHLTVDIDKLDDDDDFKILRRKQRISKEQRCSLLKQLLSKPTKERDKYIDGDSDYHKGGLKNIIDFTKNYEFSFKLDKNSNIEATPLDKLKAFSTNYFQRDFTEFNDNILYVIENRNSIRCDSNFGSDDDDYLTEFEEDKEQSMFEEVLVEPDIQLKNEAYEEESQCPLDFLETSIEEDASGSVKHEPLSDSEDDLITNIKQEADENLTHSSFNFNSAPSIGYSPSVKLLDRLVSSYPLASRKVFSSNNVRCRTRDQPYINPLLKNQFLYRSFKCERCNRYFKSQGYLKAHTSKVH